MDPWRGHIVQQLRDRDRKQSTEFRDLIRFYTQLLEKTSLTKGILSRRPAPPGAALSALAQQRNLLRKTTGELAYQVVELQQQVRIKDGVLQAQRDRQQEAELRVGGALASRRALRGRVEAVRAQNGSLKAAYDALLQRRGGSERRLREEEQQQELMLHELMQLKQQQAARTNTRNQQRNQQQQRNQHQQRNQQQQQQQQRARARHVQTAVGSKVSSSSAPTSPRDRNQDQDQDQDQGQGQDQDQDQDQDQGQGQDQDQDQDQDQGQEPDRERSRQRVHTRLFRSASATSPRIFSSIRELFDRRRRGHSVCGLEEDRIGPVGVCVAARVPTRAVQVLDAHEQGINAVVFSGSGLLASAGTDRVVKLWDVGAGGLTHRATLDGSTEGITCLQFDPAGRRILAASYDKSAMLWQLDDPVPKVTLTGHSRKVTAARFPGSAHQAVTGSADRSVRLWDLSRAACVREMAAPSACSDLVCAESCVVSGHLDSRVRVWDSRVERCLQELPRPGRVTSLDLSPDQNLLLSCCRDDGLQLEELRRPGRRSFRAEGFKCGSDSTKAVISPDGCFLAAGSADGSVYVWSVSSGTLETRLPPQHSSPISAVAWSQSGEHVVSVDRTRRAVLWSHL